MTIRIKISLLSAAVFGLLLAGFATVIYETVRETEFAKLDNRLELDGEKIQAEFEEEQGKDPLRVMEIFLSEKPAGMDGVRIRLFDHAAIQIFRDSFFVSSSTDPLIPALKGTRQIGFLQFQSVTYRSLWIPIHGPDGVSYALQLAAPTTEAEATLRSLRVLFLITFPLTLLVTALAAALITTVALRPMKKIVETARQISAQTLHTRLELPATNDEVRLLGETLNSMMERIDAAFKSQKKFIADASHELRTPLTVLRNELEFAEKRLTDAGSVESIQTALTEIDRMAKLADQLLQLVRLDSSQEILHVEPMRLDELLVDSVQRAHRLAEQKGIAIKTTIEEAVEFKGDREKLKSAIFNLLDNAIKYSSSQAEVAVRLCVNRSLPEKILLIVEDHGCGIAAADIPHLFRRFYRTDTARADTAGSGLGLAIAEQVVFLHGGAISVESEPGRGSVFTIELPVAHVPFSS